ncbi:MGH1-like glycoside hydrolase domain-containing protein [Paenibacillus sp. MMS20-IR301]|uniref:MGH1-like glycoside hydrolase domain-containing protein n=1 Tax=Paenibacillus sp. MMS20-IR301 TaxID=2895946 RepID=UPI0028E7BA8B|nr:hypothetical protein [Paenibacillus sp. MMS20-IR301]WNS46900.1 hypothetical protein LOS79_11355 [Paenibacillus sp. MMS20-IR301]
MNSEVLKRLRDINIEDRVGTLKKTEDLLSVERWKQSGTAFTASSEELEDVYYSALHKLMDCIVPMTGNSHVLHEGGVYRGSWLESTGTISSELLSRFMPDVAEATFLLFADYQREDGLIPYKITPAGPAYRQIQMVTPLARSVWNHYVLNGRDRNFLSRMYHAMSRFDDWLATRRDTRGTGCVEAFCTFDTGHDLSPRFWHIPDTPHLDDAAQFNPDSPLLPLLAPDLTANVYCQRLYLSRMAGELGVSGAEWSAKAVASVKSLFSHCYDEADAFFYDRDRKGRFVRVQSDVLLRVLACEVGDREFFDQALRRYLLNTSKFFAKYPFTSIAMDDPRFDPFSSYNTWAGSSNFLSIIRAPHAFEHHGRYVELTWVMQPILSALSRMKRFGQTLSPWTGEEGYTDTYSPAILCLLDYIERLCGILPAGGEELWFTGLLPYNMDHGRELAHETGYRRVVDGTVYELLTNRETAVIYRDQAEYMCFPFGVRVVTDRSGRLQKLIGMSVRTIEGSISYLGQSLPFIIKGNEQLEYTDGGFSSISDIGVVFPEYR